MAVPGYQEFMLPLLRLAAGGEIWIRTAIQSVADEMKISPEDRALIVPSGQETVLSNRVHWAKTYLTKARLLEITRRGYFKITERGLSVLAQKPPRVDRKLLEQFEEYRQFRDSSTEETSETPAPALKRPAAESESTPDETLRAAHRELEETLAADLIERILAAPPEFFERLIVSLLVGMGYGKSAIEAGKAVGRSGDNGIDGVVDQDALGLDRVYVQAKRYAPGNSVGSGEIRDFFGSLDRHKASKGLFVTTSSFSSSAKETAESLSKRLVLIDGRQLARLMIRFDVGCRVEETIHLKRIDEDFFE